MIATAAVQSILLLGILIISALIMSVLVGAYRSVRRKRNRYWSNAGAGAEVKASGELIKKLRESGQL